VFDYYIGNLHSVVLQNNIEVRSSGPNSFHPLPFAESMWNDMGDYIQIKFSSKGANTAYQKV
jgi:hypothetical protein